MEKTRFTFNCTLLVFIIFPFFIQRALGQSSLEMLFSKKTFEKSYSDFKPLTWWHWINGNVTTEGIRKDLIAIRKAGLGGVQLFDVKMYTPRGPVRYGTEKWYDDVTFAIRLCDSLGLKFYMMNSPGWSGAGGPWITLEQSMKQLVFSEMDVSGNRPIDTILPQPYSKEGFYRDVAVVAVPSDNDNEGYIKKQLSSITSSSSLDSVKNVYDDNSGTMAKYSYTQGSDKSFIQFDFKVPLQINMLNINLLTQGRELNITGKVETSPDGIKYYDAGEFIYNRHRAATGNFTIPIDSNNKAIRSLRLCFNSSASFKINEIKLRNLFQIDNWSNMLGMSEFPLLNRSISDTCPAQTISAKQVTDLKNFYGTDKNELKWTPPGGKWTILRFGYTTTGAKIHPAVDEGNGYEVDKLDPKAVAFQFHHSIGPIIERAGPFVGNTFKGILFDSWEAGYQNWTANFPAMFKKLMEFEITKYLPVLAGRTINSKYFSSGILWSFRDAITKLLSSNYYGTMRKLAHSHNMLVFSEAEGGPIVPAFGNAYTDIPMNEFWTNGIFQRRPAIKQTVSIANILGRKIIAAESFTSRPEYGKWQNTPYKLKAIGDLAFTLGINRFIFHTYTHQPFDNISPGFTMGRYGIHFERTNTWWKYASSWINYLSRSQLLLQQGRIIADIGYLVSEDAGYKFQPDFDFPSGYNFDIIYAGYLDSLRCVDHSLEINANSDQKPLVKYKLLVIDNKMAMTYHSLMKLNNLVKEGAIVVGPPPLALPETIYSVKYKEKFDRLVEKMWDSLDGKNITQRNYGKGRIYWGQPVDQILNEIKLIPDLRFNSSHGGDSLFYIHRKTADADIYFISNQMDKEVSAVAEVRLTQKRPEFWDPSTGHIVDVKVFDTTKNVTNIPLRLAPSGSVFLVFRKPLPDKWVISLSDKKKKVEFYQNDAINISENNILYSGKGVLRAKYSDGEENSLNLNHLVLIKTLRGPWTVEFPYRGGAPNKIVLPKLISWTNHINKGVRYFSGTAIYKNSFNLSRSQNKENQVCILDLGKLFDIAEIWINGKKVSVLWKKPYSLDVTSYLCTGRNEIKILITNTWVNRLIGDADVTVNYKYESKGTIFTKGRLLKFPDWLYDSLEERNRKRYTFTTWKHYNSNDTLLESGLLGPVRLLFYDPPTLRRHFEASERTSGEVND